MTDKNFIKDVLKNGNKRQRFYDRLLICAELYGYKPWD